MSEMYPEERLLVARARLGDDLAFAAIVHRYTPRLLWYVRRLGLTESSAEDVVQNTWLTCWTSLRRLRDIGKFRSWLYGITRNKALQFIGSINPHETLTGDIDILGDESEDSFLERHGEHLNAGLAHLPILHREVLTLRFLEGMSYAEISESTGVNEGTVKSRLHYAKAELRRRMEVLANG